MREPLCPYFGKCGGCSTQHLPYELQLENKKALLKRNINSEEIKVFHGNEFYYRNRMDMIFHAGGIGFREKQKWQNIVNVEKCVISNEKLNTLMSEVREYFKDADYFDIKKKTGTFRYAVIRTPQEDSSISFVLNSDSPRINEAVDKIKEFAKATKANNIIITYVPSNTDMSISSDFFVVKGKDMLKESFLGKEFLYSVQGFFQNNHEVANMMHEYVNGLLQQHDRTYTYLLDLYAGVGTFGIINSELFKQVTIIESVKECIDAANVNIEKNGVKNAKAMVLDAMQLRKVLLSTPLFVITDPPRSGMHPKTIQQLNELTPKVIIYISCNVEQLGKDLPKFKEYKIKSAALFDMFPQTNHCEAVVELILK
jgi:23S rRNA (uracil-5-)-methyltransferase RumA